MFYYISETEQISSGRRNTIQFFMIGLPRCERLITGLLTACRTLQSIMCIGVCVCVCVCVCVYIYIYIDR